MGSISYDLVPRASGVEITAAATYDAALTAYRSTGAAGDWYQTTDDGRYWRGAESGSTGILIPADLWTDAAAHVVNASGPCRIVSASDDASLDAGGFVRTSGANSTCTKTAGADLALTYNNTNAGSNASIDFTATAEPDLSVVVIKIASITTDVTSTGIGGMLEHTDGVREPKLNMNEGAAGVWNWMNGTSVESGFAGSLTASSGWLAWVLDKRATTRLQAFFALGTPNNGLSVKYADQKAVTTTTGRLRLRINKTSATTTYDLQVSELHWVKCA